MLQTLPAIRCREGAGSPKRKRDTNDAKRSAADVSDLLTSTLKIWIVTDYFENFMLNAIVILIMYATLFDLLCMLTGVRKCKRASTLILKLVYILSIKMFAMNPTNWHK